MAKPTDAEKRAHAKTCTFAERYGTTQTPLQPWQIALERRQRAVQSLMDSLAHLPREQQFAVLTSYMTLNALEDIARFNER